MLRLFFAVTLDEKTAGEVYRQFSRLERAESCRLVKPAQLHYTLFFLGAVAESRLPLLEKIGREAAGQVAPFDLEVSGGGFFPARGKPRLFWLGARQGGEELSRLAGLLGQKIAPAGFVTGAKDFLPHLTVARFRLPPGTATRQALQENAGRALFCLRVESFAILRSTLTPGGPVYERLREFELGQPS